MLIHVLNVFTVFIQVTCFYGRKRFIYFSRVFYLKTSLNAKYEYAKFQRETYP